MQIKKCLRICYNCCRNKRIHDNARNLSEAQIYAPVGLTGFELYENEVGGPVSFACDDSLHDSYLRKNQLKGSCRILGSEVDPEQFGELGAYRQQVPAESILTGSRSGNTDICRGIF